MPAIHATIPSRPAGGCDFAEDPTLDARDAHPEWLVDTDDLMHLRPASAPRGQPRKVFHLWRIPGRKRLSFTDEDLILHVAAGGRRMQVSLALDLADGDGCAATVPLLPGLREKLPAFQAQADAVEGRNPSPSGSAACAPNRDSLLHFRSLQALDASRAGASQRDIAAMLYGADAVQTRWHADGELRAQVRYLLTRADELMHDGYLVLAGVRSRVRRRPGENVRR